LQNSLNILRRTEELPRPAAGSLRAPSRCYAGFKKASQGISLLEMSLAVLVLSIIAAVAIPNLAANDPVKLDIAAKEIAAAIRFAQSEARRTKSLYGIDTDATNERVRVYRLPGLLPVYDVYHPVDKKLYDINLKTHPFAAGVDLVSANFSFSGGLSSSTYLGFNSEGYPKYSAPSGNDAMLTGGTIILGYGGEQRIINISPMTGRVTVQ